MSITDAIQQQLAAQQGQLATNANHNAMIMAQLSQIGQGMGTLSRNQVDFDNSLHTLHQAMGTLTAANQIGFDNSLNTIN